MVGSIQTVRAGGVLVSRLAANTDKPLASQQVCMTVIAALSVSPVGTEDMATQVSRAIDALEDHDVEYETHPMETTIEAEDLDTLLDAVAAAHRAVDADRVSTFLKIDDKRTTDAAAAAKVEAVESELGRPARGRRER
jgi:uncharacterized protein (TIGR00106 family)